MTILTIISCGKAKNKVDKCKAEDAYIGSSFKLKQQYANNHLPYMILSAKYGLITPDQEIDPNYNKTIQTSFDIHILVELLCSQIDKAQGFNNNVIKPNTFKYYLSSMERIDILAPEKYVIALSNALARCNINIAINHLTKGLSQGYQMQFLTQLNKDSKKEESIVENWL